MRLSLVVLIIVFVGACHPLACFIPAELPRNEPLLVQSKDAWPRGDVQVNVDELGIPHIYGKSEADLAYGLGVMHARDRLFQMFLYIHAGEGRLTELLGADLLQIDRQNRIITHRLDEQMAALSERDKNILEAYCAGVNEGAAMVGKSAEMQILGVEWEALTPKKVLTVVRLQQWDQSVGFNEEITRHRLLKQLGADSAVAQALLVDVTAGGVPIVTPEEHDGAPFAPTSRTSAALHVPAQEGKAGGPALDSPRASLLRALKDDIARRFSQGGTGASNSWSVGPDRAEAGVAVLANDPHLGHGAPGVFYLADMQMEGGEAGDHTFAGGTFPGIPAVLIGHGRHIAWGITNAFADTQDLVIIQKNPGQDGNYTVDGTVYAFGEVKQRFKLGKEADAPIHEETWKTTIFGPVLPPGYGSYGGESLVDEGEDIALLWTAANFPEDNSRFLSFWDLAKARTAEEATAALQDFAAPSMSINMAFTDGTIAYRLSGIIPVRGDEQRVDLPRIGSSKSAGWLGRMASDQKPQSTNPEKGYILASNQRIVDNDALSQRFVGFEAARPWRALRIHERLQELLEAGKASTADLLGIQQEAVAIDARELAPIYGAHCLPAKDTVIEGHDAERVKAFCKAVGSFDGNYTVDSTALPFARFHRELTLAVLRAHVQGNLAYSLSGHSSSAMALHNALKAEAAGEGTSPLLDDPNTPEREGIDGFAARALKPALDLVVSEAGGSESDWRWGKLHTLSLRGALSSAPVIGFLFETAAREESGSGTSPRAEASDYNSKMRVSGGAGLRLIAEMTDPPTVRMITDSGQSGHFGSRHLEDQNPLWSKGEPRVLTMSRKDSEASREGALVIQPKP